MSGNISHRINQNGNIGLVQGVNYGDNIRYETQASKSLKHIAQDAHERTKTAWEHSGTCSWLLQETDLQSWLKMDEEYSFLWLYGIRGCGKSTLMSRLIESTYQDRFPMKGHGAIRLLYFYISDENNPESYRNMLMTFWDQAVLTTEERSTHTFGNNRDTQFLETKLHELLVSLKRDIYIFIDAVDQLYSHSRYQMIMGLNEMVQKFKGTSINRISVAISSRDCDGMENLRKHKLFPIEVTAEKSKGDIATYLSKNLHSAVLRRTSKLRQQVYDKLMQKADGMFLWVSLQTLNICNMEMESQILNALESLIPPQEMQRLYKRYAEYFENTKEPIEQQICQRAIALLAHNIGPMPKEVLIIAVSLDAKGIPNQKLYQELNRNPTMIIRYCYYLLRMNEKLGVFQFCHQTVFEFFRKYKPEIYNHRIARVCLSYLCSLDLPRGLSNDATWFNPGSLETILQKEPFLSFASSNWATSLGKSFVPEDGNNPEIRHSGIFNLLKILFGKDGAVEERGNLQLSFQIHMLNLRKKIPKNITYIHIISYFALFRLFDTLRDRGWLNPNKSDIDELRPIHWAIKNESDLDGASRTAKKLIEYGADFDAKDKEGRSPLYYAAYYGNSKVIQLLIERKAQLDSTDKNSETALIAACRKHHEAIIRVLVEAGADVKIKSLFGTALHFISSIGCSHCAETILKYCGKLRKIRNDGPFGTSMHAAAFNGHSNLVKLFCSQGMSVRVADRTYGSPVTAAVAGLNPGLDPAPFVEIIQELIRNGVNINDQSGELGPALRIAAYHGYPNIVRLLLEKGAKVRKATGPMGTAYDAASDRGHDEIMKLLLGSDPNAADYAGLSASKAHDQQQIQRKLFKSAVQASSMDTINKLIDQFVILFGNEIRKGETTFLKRLAKLAENVFEDVTTLATKIHDDSDTPKKKRHFGRRHFHRDRLFSILCMGLARKDFEDDDHDSTSAMRHASEASPGYRGAATNLAQNSFEEHFPQVLNLLTQAAVKILENAIENKDRAVIRLTANTWIDGLNNLVSYPVFGQFMLTKVVQRRAAELKQHLIDPDLSPDERFKKAEALALVGIELLLTAVGRGQKFKHLSFVISKLWIKAINDVESLGEAGKAPIKEFIRAFVERFSEAVTNKDQINAETCSKAGIEIMRAVSIDKNETLLENLSNEWVIQWTMAIQKNMEYVVKEPIHQMLKDYQECLKDNKYNEGIGLAITGIAVLRSAFKQKESPAALVLQPFIEDGFELTQKFLARCDTPTAAENLKSFPVEIQDLRALLNSIISLLAIEEIQHHRLSVRPLVSQILDLAQVTVDYRSQELSQAFTQCVEEADQIFFPLEQDERLLQIARTVFCLLEVALYKKEKYSNVLSILRGAALNGMIRVSTFIGSGRLVEYDGVIEYLNLY
ncbi:uncharacterized protein EAE98_004289 [Botrytis deweyae]|uniref:Nephrocystin 3-like N-terminal domain-containing protein n=1 Tax=Botrytis deweyae TaxID=2478750 RepID=A0ABQ7IQW3_9HELO|nr:uncharacterized protein EAE98_004289 [Botrytis deweyae]KAF7931553.1 hypothetical protein EAE98_004289 [Botrytis deweyae]